MRRRSLLILVLSALSLALGAAAGAAAQRSGNRRDQSMKEAVALQAAFAQVADRVFPSLVCLTSFERKTEPAQPEEGRQGVNAWRQAIAVEQRYPSMHRLGTATGFAMSADGYLLTTLEFMKKPGGGLADLVDAETPDGTVALCEVVGTEPTLDLAVLRLAVYPDPQPPKVEPVVIADPEAIRVGHWAIAVGDPLGPQRVFAAGLISARPERGCYQAELAATFLEASLQVHPEAYGGPLVDLDGAVMGMIVPHRAGPFDPAASGLVYALPMSIASGIYESLKVARSFESPWLGVSVLSMAEYRARMRTRGIDRDRKQPAMGLYIDNVFDPSPAALAGVRIGDIFVEINGQSVTSAFDFQRALYLSGIGSAIKIDVYRDGKLQPLEVTIEARPAAADTASAN